MAKAKIEIQHDYVNTPRGVQVTTVASTDTNLSVTSSFITGLKWDGKKLIDLKG